MINRALEPGTRQPNAQRKEGKKMQDKQEQYEIIEKWPAIMEKLKTDFDITDRTYHAFLETLTISSVENDIIRICCPGGAFAIEYYQKAFYLLIKVTVEEVLKKPYEISYHRYASEKSQSRGFYGRQIARRIGTGRSSLLRIAERFGGWYLGTG